MNTHVHDKNYKQFFSDPIILKQLLESFVKMTWVKDVDFSKTENMNTTFISKDNERREADIIYKLSFKDRELYLYILLEFQSTVDRFLSLRMLRYVLEFYEFLIKNKAPKTLPIIFPILLYNGDKKWTAPIAIQDLIDQSKELGAIKPYLPHFQYFKIIENEFSEEQLFELKNVISTVFLFETGTRNSILTLINLLENRLKKQDPRALDSFFNWLNNFLSKNVKIQALKLGIDNIQSIKEAKTMLSTTLEKWEVEVREEGYKKGIQKGIEEGKEEGIEKGIKKGIKKGIEKGREEGREEEKKILTRTMLENGANITFVAKITGYSVKFLKTLI